MSKYHTTVLSQSFQMMWVTGKYQLGASWGKISVVCQISNRWERKRRGMSIRSPILFHNNTRSHVAALIQEKIDKIYWKTLERLSYSAKLSPCDYQSLDNSSKSYEVITLTTTTTKVLCTKLNRTVRCIQNIIYYTHKCSSTKVRFIFDSHSY